MPSYYSQTMNVTECGNNWHADT